MHIVKNNFHLKIRFTNARFCVKKRALGLLVARTTGLEPVTVGYHPARSIQLSYVRIIKLPI